MKARTLAKLVLGGASALVCLLGVEIGVRVLSRRDEDGNVKFRDTRLKPYRVAERKAARVVEEYLAAKDSSLIYDAELGWSQRPGHATHNRHGFITSNPEPVLERSEDTLRIAVCGGSVIKYHGIVYSWQGNYIQTTLYNHSSVFPSA